MTTLYLVRHDPVVGAGHLDAALRGRTDVVDVDATAGDLPDVTADDAVLLLGGRASVVDRPDWMDTELAWLADVVDREVPTLGLCLGAQLLGAALGGEVARRARPEVAIIPLHRTLPGQEDDLVAGWPDGGALPFVHEDEVIRLPAAADQLLTGSDGPSLWRRGSAYACQAHPEAGPDDVRAWLDAGDGTDFGAAGVDPDEFVAELERRAAFLRATGASLVLRWLDQVMTASR
jgi:GMP synthase-like glutamine amidotransferase